MTEILVGLGLLAYAPCLQPFDKPGANSWPVFVPDQPGQQAPLAPGLNHLFC